MAITIGILSDTHLTRPTELFREQVASCFSQVSMILHAGDLTDKSVLDVFRGKEIHAVHGNMCEPATCRLLPAQKTVQVGPFSIGLIHGYGFGYGHDIEERLLDAFDMVDCIVYGHTHTPVCHRVGPVLFINPGSFVRTGRYGAVGTYATLTVGDSLQARIHEVGTAR